MPKLISILLIVVSLNGLAFASDWKREVNGRWGFALTYPASLIAEVAPSDDAGRRYHSADHTVSLAVTGSHTHPEEFLDNFWQKELNTRGETVTYKFKKDNYYVISGVHPNGYEFYHKGVFLSDLLARVRNHLPARTTRCLRRVGGTYCARLCSRFARQRSIRPIAEHERSRSERNASRILRIPCNSYEALSKLSK